MKLEKLRPDKYLKYLNPTNLFAVRRTKEILSANPTIIPHREEAKEVIISVFDYNAEEVDERKFTSIDNCWVALV